jgi:hypothetical protein
VLVIAGGGHVAWDLSCVPDERKNRRQIRQFLVVARILHRQIVVQSWPRLFVRAHRI